MENNLLTIYCLTYNHIEYIEKALNGFLNQKVNFKYKIFVFDDASTDGTSDVIRRYEKEYPEYFDVHICKENIYNSPDRKNIMNRIFANHITGKYVAYCEGDDCWIDMNKLQKQVDYLEANPNCSMVGHSALWKDDNANTIEEFRPFNGSRKLTEEDIIFQPKGCIPTASLVVRREIFFKNENYPQCDIGDYPLHLYAITKGYVYYMDEVMSLYVYMHNGSWSESVIKSNITRLNHLTSMINFFDDYNLYTIHKYEKYVTKKRNMYLYFVIETCLKMSEKEYLNAIDKLSISKFYPQYIKMLNIFRNKYSFSINDKKYISKFENLLIMGNGKYSLLIKQILNNSNILYDGILVSELKTEEKNKSNFYDFETCPFEPDKTLVIVGIGQVHEEDIRVILDKYKYKNYITPLWWEEV